MRNTYPVYNPANKRSTETFEEYIVRFFRETKEVQEAHFKLNFPDTFPTVCSKGM